MSPSPPRLGQLLVDLGFIDEVQLDVALRQQSERGGRLGKILVDNAVITEERLTHALSRQLGIDSCDPVDTPVHPKVLELIPTETALELRVLPMARKREGDVDVVYVALADPLDQRAMEAVRQALGQSARVHWMIAGESEMELALEKKYGRPAPQQASQAARGPNLYQGVPVVQGLPFKADLPQRKASRSAPPDRGSDPVAPPSASGPVPSQPVAPVDPTNPPAGGPSGLFAKPGGFDLQTDFEGPAGAGEDGISYEAFGTLQSVDMQPVEDDFDGIEDVDLDDGPLAPEAVSVDLAPAIDAPLPTADVEPIEAESLDEADSRDIEPLDEDEVEALDDDEIMPLDDEVDSPAAASAPSSSDVVALPQAPPSVDLETEAAREPAEEPVPLSFDLSHVEPEAPVDPEAPVAGPDPLEADRPPETIDPEALADDFGTADDASQAKGPPPEDEEHVSEDLPEFSPQALSAFSERVSQPTPVVGTRVPARPPEEVEAEPAVRKPAPRAKSSPDPSLKWGDLLDGLAAPTSEGGTPLPLPAEAPERDAAFEAEATVLDPEALTDAGSSEVEAAEAVGLEAPDEDPAPGEGSSDAEQPPASVATLPADDGMETVDVATPTEDLAAEAPVDDALGEKTEAEAAREPSIADPRAVDDGAADGMGEDRAAEAADSGPAPSSSEPKPEPQPDWASEPSADSVPEPAWAEWVRSAPGHDLRPRLAAALRLLAENGLFDPARLEAEVESIQAKNDVRLE